MATQAMNKLSLCQPLPFRGQSSSLWFTWTYPAYSSVRFLWS